MTLPAHIQYPDPYTYISNNYLVLDFETYGKDYGSAIHEENGTILCSYISGTGTSGTIEGGILGYGELLRLCYEADFLVGHNIKYDLQWLARCGADLAKLVVFDTQIAEYVLRGNIRKPLNLDYVDKQYGGRGKDKFVDILMKYGDDTRTIPRHLLARRCKDDVRQTESIFLQQRQFIQEQQKLEVLYTRCLFTPVLADIEPNGLCLDGERVERTYRDYKRRLEDISREIDEFAGGINFRSPVQVGEFIYGPEPIGLGFSELTDGRGNPIRTSADRPKADKVTLDKLTARTSRQCEFLDLRKRFGEVNFALSKNLEFFYGVVKEYDGLFYGQFNQTITKTHRLSSSGRPITFTTFGGDSRQVQFQNLPNKFKSLFKARKDGWKIVDVDGSQLEFRVAAHLGSDAVATDAIRSGFDVHTFTADVLTDAGEPTDRKGAKAHTFKPLYGGSSGTQAQQKYYAAFRDRYPGITGAQNRWKDTVLTNKELRIPSGLVFYWPDTKLTRSGYITNSTSICNYPVQSYATADIIPIAVVKIWHELKARSLSAFIVNTVHDSIIIECPTDEIDIVKEICFDALTKYVYFYLDEVYDDKFSVQLGAEAVVGNHWTEGPEVSFSMEPPFATTN